MEKEKGLLIFGWVQPFTVTLTHGTWGSEQLQQREKEQINEVWKWLEERMPPWDKSREWELKVGKVEGWNMEWGAMRNENKEMLGGPEGWIEIGTLKMDVKWKEEKNKKNESCIMNRGEEEMRRADEKRRGRGRFEK